MRVLPVVRSVSIAWLAAMVLPALALASPESTRLERQVKAAFVYKFAGYVDWPPGSFADPATPLVIGVTGDRALADELSELAAGRTSGGRAVVVRPIGPGEAATDVHTLVVADAEEDRRRERLRSAIGRPILLVTESPGALRDGSMINFVLRDGRVRFEIGLRNAERNGLTLSSRLLSVAQTVITGRP